MTIDEENATAILATDSDTLAMGLSALLLSIPPIRQVETVESVDSLIQNLRGNPPALIIVDTTLSGERTADHLRDIRRLAPRALRVVLTENMAEFRELVFDTPDTVVIKGANPARLARTLEYLLHNRVVA